MGAPVGVVKVWAEKCVGGRGGGGGGCMKKKGWVSNIAFVFFFFKSCNL